MRDGLKKTIEEAVSSLKKGGVVAFPTETVYAVGADPMNEEAVSRIFRVKKRSRAKPLTLLLSDAEELETYVKRVPKGAQDLIQKLWPGPLTLILKASSTAPEYLLGTDRTIGVRATSSQTARALIRSFGSPLATTSANLSGTEPMRSGSDVVSQLGEAVQYVLPGFTGTAPPSVVLNLSRIPPTIDRAGSISPLLLARTMRRRVRLGETVFFKILMVCTGNACRSPMAEGMLADMIPDPLKEKVIVTSAGTAPLEGAPPTTSAVQAARELGGDISGLLSKQLMPQMIADADLILAMERIHRDKVAEIVPEAWEKTHLLKGYGKTDLPTSEREIEDPIGMPLAFYRKTAAEIRSGLKGVVSELARWLTP